jgi:hypothetical protein
MKQTVADEQYISVVDAVFGRRRPLQTQAGCGGAEIV